MEKKNTEVTPVIGADEPNRKPRRRFSAEEKGRLLAESEAPGSSVSLVARKYGLSASLLDVPPEKSHVAIPASTHPVNGYPTLCKALTWRLDVRGSLEIAPGRSAALIKAHA
jgi:hypothetical protein